MRAGARPPGIQVGELALGYGIAIQIEAVAVMRPRALDIFPQLGQVSELQAQVRIVRLEIARRSVGASRSVPPTALLEHMAELHPDAEVVRCKFEKRAVGRFGLRPASRVPGLVACPAKLIERSDPVPVVATRFQPFRQETSSSKWTDAVAKSSLSSNSSETQDRHLLGGVPSRQSSRLLSNS